MALQPCRECGRQVSTEAPACPQCGVPDPTRPAQVEKPLDALGPPPQPQAQGWPPGVLGKIITLTKISYRRSPLITVFVGLFLVVLIIEVMPGVVVGTAREEEPSPPARVEPATAEPRSRSADGFSLNARVRFTGTQIVVENHDRVDWSNCRVDVNPGFVRGGHFQRMARIPAGVEIATGIMAFTTSSGERFNPVTHSVQEVRVQCDTPRGRGFHYARF